MAPTPLGFPWGGGHRRHLTHVYMNFPVAKVCGSFFNPHVEQLSPKRETHLTGLHNPMSETNTCWTKDVGKLWMSRDPLLLKARFRPQSSAMSCPPPNLFFKTVPVLCPCVLRGRIWSVSPFSTRATGRGGGGSFPSAVRRRLPGTTVSAVCKAGPWEYLLVHATSCIPSFS